MNRARRIAVSTDERWLLLAWRSAPEIARALAASGLMNALMDPLPYEQKRLKRAVRSALRSLHLKNDKRTGEQFAAWHRRQRETILGMRLRGIGRGNKTVRSFLKEHGL